MKGADASGLVSSLAPTAPVGAALKTALEACGSAAGHMANLQSHRGHVVEARMEALAAKQKEMAEARDALTAQITSKMK